MTDARPDNRGTENEDLRTPAREGEPPHPATEPRGSEGSSNSGETATDPATGEPNTCPPAVAGTERPGPRGVGLTPPVRSSR